MLGLKRSFKGVGGGKVEKKSFTTTAFGGEIVLGPVKEFVPFFCQMTEVIFCYILLFCWFASTNGEMIHPLDVIIQHSKEKNKRQLRFFLSGKKKPWKVTYAMVLQEHFILSKPDTSSTTQKLECRHAIAIKITMLEKLCSGE